MIKLFGVLGDILGRLLRWWDERKAINKGRDLERKEAAVVVQEKAHVAEEVRQAVRDDIAAEPDKLRDDDGFRRD